MENRINYFTEKDLIQRYSNKRDLTYEQVEDVYKAFRSLLLKKLNDFAMPKKAGYKVKQFGSFIDRELKISDLKRGFSHPKYIKAEEQLSYYLSGYLGLKVK